MQKYADVVLDRKGNVVANAQVRVKTSAGVDAALYTDNEFSTLINPILTDNFGRFAFYAENGRYNLQVYLGNALLTTQNDILLEDPLDETPEIIKDGIIRDSALFNITIDGKPPAFGGDVEDLDERVTTIEQTTGVAGRWAGASATEPTTRLNGSPLQEGDEYQNTDTHLRYSYSGGVWSALNTISKHYPFLFAAGQDTYDVSVISGDPATTTSGLALEVEGTLVYDFTLLAGNKQFTLGAETMAALADGAKMRIMVNARFDNLIQNFADMQEGFAEEYEAAYQLEAAGRETAYQGEVVERNEAYQGEKVARTEDYYLYLGNLQLEPALPYIDGAGLNLVRPTQTVTQSGVRYRPKAEYLPFTTTNWVADVTKFVVAEDMSLRQELALNGAAMNGYADPVAPTYLPVTSDILNGLPINLLRNIPKTEHAKIRARTSDYLCGDAMNGLLAAMRDQNRGTLIIPRGLVRVDKRVGLDYGSTYTEIEVQGEIGAEIRNMSYSATLVFQGSSSNLIKAKISKLRVTRENPDGFTGIIGPKSVFIRYSIDSEISDVIEEGGIGFGISMQNAIDPKGYRLVAKNHKGGAGGAVGTDGIHFSAVTRPVLVDCFGENLADDCVSVGSFDPAWPSTDVRVTRCGGKNSSGSAFKLYRLVDGAQINTIFADGTSIGGVSLYDDRNDTSQTHARYIRNVTIRDVRAKNINNTIGAYNRAVFNIFAQPGTQSSEFSDIRFLDSNGQNCISGAVTKIDAAADVRDLEISRFVMKNQYIAPSGLNPNIYVQGIQGRLTLHGNRGVNLAEGLISLDNQPGGGYSNPFTDAHISIKDNYASNFGLSLATDPAIKQAAVFIRPSDKTMVVNMADNEAYGQVFDGSTAQRAAYQFGGDVSPLSIIEMKSCVSDVEASKLSITVGGAGVDGFKTNAMPTTGTWIAGWEVFNTLFTGVGGTTRKWECTRNGTFGTLTGVTASGNINTNLLTLNNAAGIYAGEFITVNAVRYRIMKVTGNQLRVDVSLAATITDLAVSYSTPVFSTIVA